MTGKELVEKFLVPVALAAAGALVLGYWITGDLRDGDLVLEDVSVRDSSDAGLNRYGSWKLVALTERERQRHASG